MEKKQVKVKVINADWEIKKYELKKRCNAVTKFVKDNSKQIVLGFAFGAGIATVVYIKESL